jgi:hypothetical protein
MSTVGREVVEMKAVIIIALIEIEGVTGMMKGTVETGTKTIKIGVTTKKGTCSQLCTTKNC